MAHYLLSVYTPADGTPPSPEELEVIMKQRRRLPPGAPRGRGLGVRRRPRGARHRDRRARLEGGEVLTTDGPFAETKEYLGGFWLVDAPDLDAALELGPQGGAGDGAARSRCGRSMGE